MTAEQQLREALAYVEEAYDRKRNPNLSILLPAVGRLLEPIPYKPPNKKGIRHHNDCLHDLPGITICDCDQGDIEAYRAWLIGGDK